jgi:signal transduction histidine kinase/DNA-binding NarL/FixJ family response regulator
MRTGKRFGASLFLFGALFLYSTPVWAQTGQEFGHPAFQRFTARELRAPPQTWVGVQTPSGTMLFGGTDSVLEYDGGEWRTIPIPNGGFIRGLARDPSGTIWVGGVNEVGKLSVGPDGYRFSSLSHLVPAQFKQFREVWEIFVYNDGVFFFTANGFLVCRDNRFEFLAWPTATDRSWVGSVAGQRVLAHATDQGLYQFVEGRFRLLSDDPLVREARVYQMLELPGGDILLLTLNRGLLRVSGSTAQPFKTEADQIFSNASTINAVRLPNERLAIGIRGRGIVLLDLQGKLIGGFLEENGLQDPTILSLATDRTGGLWICSDTALTRVELGSNAQFFDHLNGLGRADVQRVLRHKGELFAASKAGVFRLETGTVESGFARFKRIPETPSSWAITEYANGLLIAGSALLTIEDHKAVPLPFQYGWVSTTVSSARRAGLVYLCMQDGLAAIRWDGTQWVDEGRLPGLVEDVRSLVELPGGDLLVGTLQSGIFQVGFREGTGSIMARGMVQRRPLPDWKETTSRPAWVVPWAGGCLVFYQSAIVRFNARTEQFSPFEVTPRLTNETIDYAFGGQSPKWHYWIRTIDQDQTARGFFGRRLWWLDPEGVRHAIPNHIVDGLGEVREPWEEDTPEGSLLWLAGSEGIARVKRDRAFKPKAPFRLEIRAVSGATGQPIPLPPHDAELVLPFAQREIKVRLNADRFDPADQIQLQTRIEGAQMRSFPPSNKLEWQTPALAEGRYQLHATAVDTDGVTSNESVLRFAIQPPWYRTWWMLIAYVVLGIVFLALVVRWRVWQLRKRERELVAEVEARTAELLESQQRLKEVAKNAEAANRAKSAFLANMSHELRTPLNSILGYSQLLLRDPRQERDHRVRLRTIFNSGEHLLQMINEMLDLSKVESGAVTVELKPVQLIALLNGVAEELRMRAAQKKLAFNFSIDPALPEWIATDPLRLRQILYNLLGNAIKFTSRGEVGFHAMRADEMVRVEVFDTGSGIPDRELSRVFEPFYQASNNRQASQGVGLGLYICQRIVQLLGGEMTVSSIQGHGSTFSFYLPCNPVDPVVSAGARDRIIGYEGPRKRILVIDDNPQNRRVVQEFLESVGFNVTWGASTNDGLAALRHQHFDLVISDIRMPGKDGYALIREINELPGCREMIKIASSASVYLDDQRRAKEAGYHDFLPKPVAEEELYQVVGRHLGLRWIRSSFEALPATKRAFTSPEEAESTPLGEPLPAPPELATVLEHARLGDVVAVRREIQLLRSKDPLYATFCDRLEILADNFRMGAVEVLLRKAASTVATGSG